MLPLQDIQPAAPDNWQEAISTIIIALLTWYIGHRDRRKKPRNGEKR